MNHEPESPPEQPGEIVVFIIRRNAKRSKCGEELVATDINRVLAQWEG